MNNSIEQRLVDLLQPLIDVNLKIKDGIEPEGAFADLEITVNSTLGMGNEVTQGVDSQGNLIIYSVYRSEITIRYFGSDAVNQLCSLANQLRCVSVIDRFQKADIGIGTIGKVEAVDDIEVKGRFSPDARFDFSIHYTTLINDTVGAIEHVNVAREGGEINIHLTR